MYIKLTKHFEVDQKIRNYDYSKFAVYTNSGAYITNIYKHSKVFYSLFSRQPFESVDECLQSLHGHLKINEHYKRGKR